MSTVLLISWFLGIVISIVFTIGAWVTKNKQAWETAPYFFAVMLLTGYITAIPIIAAVILIQMNRRFE
jgi:ABC-type methionine transport system permease subunit